MSTLSIRSHVSFDTDDDTHIGPSSSPTPQMNEPLVASSSSPIRNDILPLGPSRTIPALNKRGVIFSPRTDTKYFHSDDLILINSPKNQQLTPKSPTNPSSIRSYSDPITPFETPSSNLSKSKRNLSDTPTLVRSILKSRIKQQIRLANSVEEGTLNNKEAARLLVSGKRPTIKNLKRDSFQLALIRNAAQDSSSGLDRKGKTKMTDEIPSSDDSNSSDIPGINPNQIPSSEDNEEMLIDENSSEEEEETIEEDGALSTASLVNIILDGAEDLLTLEEAYNTLTLRLRTRIPTENDPVEELSTSQLDDIRISTQPLKDEAPAMVRAIQRDLQRLLGKLPSNEIVSSDSEMTPFRGLMPLQDPNTPTNQRGRFTPSPTPGTGPKTSSPTKPNRQGYTEAEVRYRREASGVGAAVLRFLTFVFHSPHLFTCFSEADLQALLEQVMAIPRTPKLPTPNPKRTYYLSIVILAQMNLPSACVQPVKDKIVRALEGAMADTLGAMGGVNLSGKEGPSAVRKEGFNAVTNLVSNYPTILFPHYTDLLSSCLRAMTNPNNIIRYKAGSAISAFARAKYHLLYGTQNELISNQTNSINKENFIKVKSLIAKSEVFVISHLKNALKVPGKSTPVYGKDGEKKIEWHSLEQIFKDTVGSVNDVHWACASWSLIVTLMGSAYASSGLSNGFDHIMDRSLQPSTNTCRPLLARVAWNHAIHAYLSSGSASSVSEDGKLIRSYKPFAATSLQTVEQRTANIQFPVDLALSKATDKASYARALTSAKPGVESHYIWQRSEKSKKLQWLITCGLGATAVLWAYTSIALVHEDQPAKEMSQISGLPSSDGMVIPDLSPEESKLPRLDNAWEKVVNPMLRSFFAICGVDKLTIHGWKILEAITAPNSDLQPNWKLERLLTTSYMDGEVFLKEKEFDMTEFLNDIQDEELQPCDIPSWGQFWAAKRLGRLITLFDEALSSIYGINDSSNIDWIENENGMPIIPKTLSNIWKNLLLALKSAKITHSPPTPLFLVGLQTITKQLTQIFNRDPKSYVPITKIDEKGRCVLDEDELRISLISHLFDIALEVLGEEILGTIRLQIDQSTSASIPDQLADSIFQNAFGGDANGHPTVAGTLLGQLLRSKIPSSPILQSSLQVEFKNLISKVLNIGSAPGYAGKLLGDITNSLPFLFENNEEIQLEIWRIISIKWTEIIDLQPTSGPSSTSSTSTNHTGALLVSLLSGPFRNKLITSNWHSKTTKIDFEIWSKLLNITILRFKIKKFGSNCGVLETFSGHLQDFLINGEKTKSTTITLSCLSSAISYLSFTSSEESQVRQGLPWDISNDNFVPIDFLTLINDSLVEAYPTKEEEDSEILTETEINFSPAVFDLLENTVKVFKDIPIQFVGKVLQPIKNGLAIWLEDKERVVGEEMSEKLDELYISLLNTLSSSIPSEDLPLDSETLNSLAELYIPRISKATSSAVPLAFQSFWNKTFGTASAQDLEYSEDVADFLRDLLVAVPNMIICPGLKGESQLSSEESLQRFPHIQLTRLPSPIQEPDLELEGIEPISVEIELQMTNPEYDADISQSIEQTQPQPRPQLQLVEGEEEDILVDSTTDDILVDTIGDLKDTIGDDHLVDTIGDDNLIDTIGDDILVDATKDDIQPPSSPMKQPNEVVEQTASEDVFGPAAMTKTSKSKKKKIGKKSKSKTSKGKGKTTSPETDLEESLDIQSLPEVQRTRTEPPTNSHSLPEITTPLVEDSENDDCIVVVPSPGFYKRRGLRHPGSLLYPTQDEDVVAEEEIQDAIGEEEVKDKVVDTPITNEDVIGEEEVQDVVADTPITSDIPDVVTEDQTSKKELEQPLPEVEAEFEMEPTQENEDEEQEEVEQQPQGIQPILSNSSPVRASLLSSASRWFSKVQSLPFFSPSTTTISPVPANIVDQMEEQIVVAEDPVLELTEDEEEPEFIEIKKPSLKKGKKNKSIKKRKGSISLSSIESSGQVHSGSQVDSIKIEEPTKTKQFLAQSQSLDSISSSLSTRSKGKRKAIEIDQENDTIEESSEPRRSQRKRPKSTLNPSSENIVKPIQQETTPIPDLPIEIDDDEDELLLSPESARRTKREEEEEVSKASQSRFKKEKEWSQSISGRFDDAPGDSSIPLTLPRRPIISRTPSSPSPRSESSSLSKSRSKSRSSISSTSREGSSSSTSSPLKEKLQIQLPTTSPNKRTNQQSKLIKMLDDAVKTKQIIDNLDYHGVKSLLKNLNTLREAAEERMITRMEELRNDRR